MKVGLQTTMLSPSSASPAKGNAMPGYGKSIQDVQEDILKDVLLELTWSMDVPIWAGDLVTMTPASWRAAIFWSAPPFPPDMIAPAWPILRPGGAVKPAMKDTTGFAFAPFEKQNNSFRDKIFQQVEIT